MNKSICLPVVLLLLSLQLRAQSISVPVGPSPEAARLASSEDLPVGLFTGQPDINIPIWTIKGTQLADHVQLSYDAADLKVFQDAGPAGLGWALQAGGLVTRTMHGLPDEKGGRGFLSCQPLLESNPDPENLPYALKRLCAEGQLDLEPDVFNVSAPGLQCRLVFAFDPVMGTLRPHPTPFSHIRVQESYGIGGITTWVITNVDGVTYHFGTLPGQRSAVDVSMGSGFASGSTYNSAWYLLKMVSPGHTDSIEYYYDIPYASLHSSPVTVMSFPLNGCQASQSHDLSLTNTQGVRLTRITYTGGEIRLRYSSNRIDLPYPEPMLDTVQVFGRGNTLIRYFVLWHSYFNSGNIPTQQAYLHRRLRLDSVAEFGAGNQRLPAYKLSYHSGQLPPKDSKAIDHWGYYNGAIQNQTFVPSFNDAGVSYQGADRECNPNTCIYSSLQSITNPLGGKLVLNWEAHRYRLNPADPASSSSYGGGLRIAEVVRHDGINPPFTRRFLYSGDDGLSSGILVMGNPLYFYIDYMPQIIQSQHGLPVISGICTRLNLFSSNQIQSSSAGAPVVYTRVRELFGPNGEFGQQESVFTFTPETRIAHYPFPPSTSIAFKRGQISEKITRNAEGKLRERELFFYQYPDTMALQMKGLKVAWLEKSIGPAYDRFQMSLYHYEGGFPRTDSTVSIEYDDQGLQARSTSKKHHYRGSLHLQPDCITSYFPDGRVENLAFIYSEDLLPASAMSINYVSYHADRRNTLIQRIAVLDSLCGNDTVPAVLPSLNTAVFTQMELDGDALFDSLETRPGSMRIAPASAGTVLATVAELVSNNILGTIWMKEQSVREGSSHFLMSSEIYEHSKLAPGLIRPKRVLLSETNASLSLPGSSLSVNAQGQLLPASPHQEKAEARQYDAAGRLLIYREPDDRLLSLGYDRGFASPSLLVRGAEFIVASNFNGMNIGISPGTAPQAIGSGDTACQLPVMLNCPSAGSYRVMLRYQGSTAPVISGGNTIQSLETIGTDMNGWKWASLNLQIPAAGAVSITGSGLIDDLIFTSSLNLVEYRKYNTAGNIILQLDDDSPAREYEYDAFGRLIKSIDLNQRTRESWEYRQNAN